MSGILIAGMGLPGSGKSSVFAALADLLKRKGQDASLYREPEEAEWPAAVHERDTVGFITALTWFRAIRVPMLYNAVQDKNDGKIALVDSFYDKLIHLYFDNPSFAWLMPPDDHYRLCYRSMIEQDYHLLPNADCIVTFAVQNTRWANLVKGRGRDLDRKSDLLQNHHMQAAFVDASNKYCAATGAISVVYNNELPDLALAAEDLYATLVTRGVLNG